MDKLTKRMFKTIGEEEAFKSGYESSLPNIIALKSKVIQQEATIQHQQATIQQLRASINHRYQRTKKRQSIK